MTSRKRVAAGFAIVIALSLVPGVLIAAGNSTLASVTTLAALGAIMPALTCSLRVAAISAGAMTVASGVAAPASGSPLLGALLLGVVGVAFGLTARLGVSSSVVMAAISVVFLVAQPVSIDGQPASSLQLMGLVGVSALWGLGAGHLGRRVHKGSSTRTPKTIPWSRAGAYAAVLAVVLGIGGWIVVDTRWGHTGGWFLMTFLLILQPNLRDSWRLTIGRGLGTIVGVVLAVFLFTIAAGATVLLYIIAVAAAVAALTLRTTTSRPYWQYVTLLTPAVVLLEGLGASVTQTARERLVATLLAVGVALAVQFPLSLVGRHRAHRHDDRQDDRHDGRHDDVHAV